MPEPRIIAGLSCTQVLGHLSDFVDGDLSEAEVRQVRLHLAGCNHCDQFGAEFGAVLSTLREVLARPEPLDVDMEQRLHDRLSALLDSEPPAA